MEDKGKTKIPPYEAPKIVNIDTPSASGADCSTGPGATNECISGNTAGGNCGTGTSAYLMCGVGNTPGQCTSGNYPTTPGCDTGTVADYGGTCVTGTSAVTCSGGYSQT